MKAFIPCETVSTASDLLGQLLRIETINLAPHQDPVQALKDELGHGRDRTLVVLDNLDTALSADTAGTIDLLAFLSAMSTLSLVVTSREINFLDHPQLSGPPQSFTSIILSPLHHNDTKELYLNIAPSHQDDPDLWRLLRKLDGHPLTIRVIASQAKKRGSTVSGLLQAWERERSAMIKTGRGAGDRLTSLAISASLSLASLENNSDTAASARDLLWFLARLPDGISVARLEQLGSPHFPAQAW